MKMGGCIVYTVIIPLLHMFPFISLFFFLSNFRTLKYFVTFCSRTVRHRKLKLNRKRMGQCIVYTGIRLLIPIHPIIMSPQPKGGAYCFWCGSCRRRRPRSFLFALYLVNQYLDFDQTCTDIFLGRGKEVIRFW